MIAERDRQIGFCLSAWVPRTNLNFKDIVRGQADGRELSDRQYDSIKATAHDGWKQDYPGVNIVYLQCPVGLTPLNYAVLEAHRLVVSDGGRC